MPIVSRFRILFAFLFFSIFLPHSSFLLESLYAEDKSEEGYLVQDLALLSQSRTSSKEPVVASSATVLPMPPPQLPEDYDYAPEDIPLTEALEKPGCGNAIVESGEECDDGNRDDLDGCNSSCKTVTTEVFSCGDGEVNEGEACDDANTRNGDGCSASCQSEEERVARCGDGILDRGEQCDDGNSSDSDGCNNQCQNSRCGDGLVSTGEQCDDANQVPGDGCSESCQNETVQVACGNGKIESGEACDDGNTNGNDGCSAKCAKEICGDGQLQSKEQCESGSPCPGSGFICDTRSCSCADCSSAVQNQCLDDADCPSGSVHYSGQDCVLEVGVCSPVSSTCPGVSGSTCSFKTEAGQWDSDVSRQIRGTTAEGCNFTCDAIQKSCAGSPAGPLTYSNARFTGGSFLIAGDPNNCQCDCQTGIAVGGPGCVDITCPPSPALNCAG
ncbi:MAG: DUF4215 domain-containing protein [Candidatus Omnitrophica bacterium]|nr:DUF4215 domain-containing protein [Candidatus Omnitrophota bacterium]